MGMGLVMVKTERRQWSYIVLLGLSVLVFVSGWKLQLIHLEPPQAGTEAEFGGGYQEAGSLDWLKEILELLHFASEKDVAEGEPWLEEEEAAGSNLGSGQENAAISGNNPGQGEESGGKSFPQEVAQVSENTLSVSGNEIGVEKEREIFTADTSYFDDALFIGDSRTVGLSEYGNLGQAEVLADSGMSVYKILKTDFPTKGGGKMRLEQLLTERQFGKIYIMLGINELGYDFDQTVKKYQEVVELIRRMQPEAIIFVEANLHITGMKSETSPYYNNENINRFNHAIEKMADGKTIFYLDVNPLFDDEGGNLSSEYTADHTHILGKYYGTWVDWILTQAR